MIQINEEIPSKIPRSSCDRDNQMDIRLQWTDKDIWTIVIKDAKELTVIDRNSDGKETKASATPVNPGALKKLVSANKKKLDRFFSSATQKRVPGILH
ncbi:hypothetical protein [Niabella beijingensis]|uniref:hypothetical protein n=1 Tax=Niabella beijingensis TaxID=2872700 RepID=UPI001CBF37FE|nr:hypothetical protein [Niabella beijingensis]MBZ4189388.1 hypothetical protein [Niabella beijingensis]